MSAAKRVLLLAGTRQARRLAQDLSRQAGVQVIASFAGATRAPLDLGVETRIGGFGGADGLRRYLEETGIDVLVDATHPFASTMTATAARVATALALPHAILQRPAWQARPQDRWHFVDDLCQAAALIPRQARVFLGTGRGSLQALSNLAPRPMFARVIDPPDAPFPFDGGRYVVGRPPFSVEEEVAFFKAERIDWLVIKNSGGAESFSKLEAASRLHLPVVLQNRPALPPAQVFDGEAGVMDWIRGQL